MPGVIDELSVLLGRIDARLTTIEDQQREERQSAIQHRANLTLVISAQSTATQALTARVDNLVEDVKEVKILSNDYRENRDQAKGAAKAVLFFRMVVVGLATAVGAIITWIISFGHGK